MKKLVSFLTFLLLFCCCTKGMDNKVGVNERDAEKTVVDKHGQLSVSGVYLVNEKGEKVVLRGVSFGWHNWWPRFYNAGAVETFATDWQCDVVRASIGVDPERGFISEPAFSTECATSVIDAAIENGIYVIIDWHSHTIRTKEAVQFFSAMARKYKDYPNIIYEIFNEPVDDSWETVKAYSEEVIKTIRAFDKSNVILVGSPHWSQDVHIVADNPLVGFENIMYTLHFYAATHHQFLRDRANYAISKGIPIFVSECAGMEATGDGAINYNEWQTWLNWMAENHISWIAWSIADKDETCSMLLPSASSTGKWEDEELKEWGQIVKKEISDNH
ncbi:MAG: glycoside hydrolase family 5 protein [Bacteroidota bacterium]|jgi:endoglucanase|nr:glycoside hydrolase family 5 protein [Bacteroidota bacterium]